MREFGLWSECPTNASVAWGARAIVNGGYPGEYGVDLLWDRQSWNSDEDSKTEERSAFSLRLNAGPLKAALKEARRLLDVCEMEKSEAGLFILYDGDGMRIVGNTNGSYGYLYLIAFPFGEEK